MVSQQHRARTQGGSLAHSPFSSSSGSATPTACRPCAAGVSSLSARRSVRPRTVLNRERGGGGAGGQGGGAGWQEAAGAYKKC